MNRRTGKVLFGLTTMASMIAQAYAQDAAPMQQVQVTGYRASLETSAKDKREAVGFQDSVFAEDLGKFPDSNIAESLNRIPGIQISREIDGEGLNIQIRGLGTSFTKVLLNGAPIAVASTGRTDNQNTNREVDLDLLPTDLFRKLTVSKSPTAAQIEGGAAGVVDMRTARPFDDPGRHFALNVTGTNNTVADKWGNRGSMLGSQTWGKEFGILGGFAWSQAKVHTTGFESVGWTNANLSAAQDSAANRNSTGGGNFTVPSTVPATAGNGLAAGTVIDQAFLLAHNPGLTIQQIDNAIIPRLGRVMDESGTKDKYTAVFSAEYRPLDSLRFYVDTMYSKKNTKMARQDMNWSLRNGSVIPLNMKVDGSCENGCVATGGTFANTQSFLEFRPYTEDTKLWGLNPGVEWDLGDKWKLDGQVNLTKSDFKRQSPTVLLTTGSSTITYANNGAIPSITSNLDLNNPASFGYNSGSRVNVQDELRNTQTKGAHTNLSWGDKAFTIKGGLAYDDISRRITSLDNSGAWQAAVCGNNPSQWINGNAPSVACNGIVAPGSAAALYPGYGTGYTAGQTTPIVYQGSLIPATALTNYIHANPSTGFVTVDWDKFSKDSNYNYYESTAPQTGSANTGASAGYISEKTKAIYLEASGATDVAGLPLRYDAGVRYVRTSQVVGGFISAADPRNAAQNLTLNGSKYPSINSFYYLDNNYSNTLPSASAALNLTKDLVARASVSRSMTRADPNAMRPGTNFSSPSADTGSIGNPALTPYISDNLDLGLEWYTGREGYVSATVFQKQINGFTVQENVTMPFSDLAAQGVTYASLSQSQKDAIDARGGPTTATVVMTRSRNATGKLKIQGLELGWVQPLDKWLPNMLRGFGFSESATLINQSASGEGSNGFIALGVPKKTNSFTAYYQQHGYSARLSHTYSDGSQVSGANQNGITKAAIFSDPYKQLDLSTSIDLEHVLDRDGWPTLTFDIVNLNRNSQRTYFQFSNATYTEYKPGRTFNIGLRAKF
ncbi:TonB-dependent receptor [Duganella sp. FT135W]|uniref:TonB-dependent receptor n=1 Tax=Duganella flavida TaxID=2692175 RepID=A0A6L8KER4_9BURK|nr:TonB-dependent receptor [Duganella flavida]MYM24312.1 TonB-dependent receptor [Duganella flavida]